MKKFFVNPESEIIELIPAEDIMAGILAASGETTAGISINDPNEYTGDEYQMWKGFNN